MKDVEIYCYVWCMFMEKIKVFEKKFKIFLFEWYWIAWVIVFVLALCKCFEFAIALLSAIFLTQKQKLEEISKQTLRGLKNRKSN